MSPILRLPGAVDPSWSEIPDACVCTALRMLNRYASRRLDRVLTQRWRFSEWVLETAGVLHLEVLEPIWYEVDQSLRSEFGSPLVTALIRKVDSLPAWVPREAQGWFD